MNYTQISDALAALSKTTRTLEDAYCDNGGEVTEETEALEATKEALRELLTTEGVDSLGRWLKAKQDEIETAKAEKAAADRRLKSLKASEDFIKHEIRFILNATETEKVKGTYYSFAKATSTKSSVLTDALDDAYLDLVTEAARAAGLPGCIDVALKTTTSRLNEAGEDFAVFVDVETSDTVKFTKPRKVAEE